MKLQELHENERPSWPLAGPIPPGLGPLVNALKEARDGGGVGGARVNLIKVVRMTARGWSPMDMFIGLKEAKDLVDLALYDLCKMGKIHNRDLFNRDKPIEDAYDIDDYVLSLHRTDP